MKAIDDLEKEKTRIKEYFNSMNDDEFEIVLKRNGMDRIKPIGDCDMEILNEEE